MMYIAPPPKPQETPAHTDSLTQIEKKSTPQISSPVPNSVSAGADTLSLVKFGTNFSNFANGNEKLIRIESDEFSATFSSKGGKLIKWELKQFTDWKKERLVQLVEDTKKGDLNLLFSTTEGKIVNTGELYFQTNASSSAIITNDNSHTLEFILPISGTSKLIRRYVFKNGEYGFQTETIFLDMQHIVAGDEIQLVWEGGLRLTEFNSVDEAGFAQALAYSGGELTTIDAASIGENPKSNFSGLTNWVGTHNKYFGLAFLAQEEKSTGGYLEGKHLPQPNQGVKEIYKIALKLPFKGTREEKIPVTVFLGPLDKSVLQSYNADLDQMLQLGWAWIIRPISEYFIVPLFNGIHYFIPNYGIVLIVFSLIIKILLHPLTKKSMDSMRKMQKLQPMIAEMKEKYKDEPTKVNQAMMKMYSEYGVNPAGGCLPIILQMPILFSLFSVFRSTIDLRHASFAFWITDLSVHDVLFTLPFSIPLLGTNEISGLALLLGITQFYQSKQTTTDPSQKMMIYMMPVMMFFLFNTFPSGLNLYYVLFNILSIAQQQYINRSHKDEPLQKVDPKNRKSSWVQRMAKQAEEARTGRRKK